MPAPSTLLKRPFFLKRWAIFIHRWLGVALSLLFFLWFASGIVMMYWSFPAVTQRDRLEHGPPLDPARIRLSPEQAYAVLDQGDPPARALLTTFDGRPVYRFGEVSPSRRGANRRDRMVFADDGSIPPTVDASLIDRVASSWAGLPLSAARKESIEEVDQWTVAGGLRALRPLYKYTFNDGQEIYISGINGDVVQYTTRESRFWAYIGAIPHWLYFTPLRKNQTAWSGFVIWSSGIGTIAALIGIIIALWMLSPSKRYRIEGEPTRIPYSGWKRWHTIIGLVFGICAITWAFSGLLSMGPFDLVDRLTGNPREPGRTGFRPNSAPLDLSAFRETSPARAIQSLRRDFVVKELELVFVAGDPRYIAFDGSGHTRTIGRSGGEALLTELRSTLGSNIAELRILEQYDAYYLDRTRGKPLPVIYLRLNDAPSTRYYIDPQTGRLAGVYDSRNWVNRWLYHGLHSLDFPWLYNHRPLWDILVIALMLGGGTLCATSLILAWNVLMRKLLGN